MAEHSVSNMVVFICEICDQMFSSEALFKDHEQSHIVSEPYKCDICQSTFSLPKELKDHLLTHVSCTTSASEENCNMSVDETTAPSTQRTEDEIMNSNVEKEEEPQEETSEVQVGSTEEGNDAPWSILYPICHDENNESSKDSDNVETLEESTEYVYVVDTLVPREPQYRKLGKMQYQCLICNEVFTQVSHVKSHHVSHTGEKAFKCEDCGTMFTTPSSRRRHYSRFSHGQQYPDITKPRDQCNEEVLKIPAVRKVLESLASDEDLLKHQTRESKMLLQTFRSNLNKSDVEEDSCVHTINSSVGTQTSIKAVVYDISKCGNCEIFGNTKCRIHGQIYKQLPYKCRLCMKYFQKYYELQKHRLKHTVRARHPYYRCGICDAVFTKISKYVIHMRSHPLSRPMKPKDLKSIINHVMDKCSNEKFYRDDERPFKCFVCFKRFKTKTNLKGHYLTHQNLKPHICQTCGTAFTTPSSLNRHQFRFGHSGQIYRPDNLVRPKKKMSVVSEYHRNTPRRFPFMCKHCDIRFHRKADFQKHFIEVHSQFPCEICPKQFDTDTDLENHQLGHFSLVYSGDEWKLIPKNGAKKKSKHA